MIESGAAGGYLPEGEFAPSAGIPKDLQLCSPERPAHVGGGNRHSCRVLAGYAETTSALTRAPPDRRDLRQAWSGPGVLCGTTGRVAHLIAAQREVLTTACATVHPTMSRRRADGVYGLAGAC